MANDLVDFQADAIARGYTYDFAFEGKSAPASPSKRSWLHTTWTFDAHRIEREEEVYG